MADTKLTIFQADGTTAAIDYRTEATNLDGRQVIVIGDPSINANVVNAVTADPGPTSTTPGLVFRMAGSVNVSAINTTVTVKLDPGYTLGSVQGINSTVGVYFDGSSPAVSAQGLDGVTKRPLRMNSDGAIKVYEVANGTMTVNGSLTGITNSLAVHVLSTGGTLIIKPDPAGTFFTNNASTVNIFTVAGSTSGVSVSGVQLVAPSANASFKVFAFSLQTTGIVSTVARFTNGGGSATEFWRGLVTANQTSSTPIGANLAVQPPGFLFATGASTTLALHLDTATLVHYSVSYIKESA